MEKLLRWWREATSLERETAREHSRRTTWVTVATLVVGGLILWGSLTIPPGNGWFYVATTALALVWIAGGRLASRRRQVADRRPSWPQLRTGMAVGAIMLVVFLAGAVVVARIPVLRGPVDGLLAHSAGALLPVALITVVNGIAEEFFFRGGLWDALPARFRLWGTTALYTAVTAFSLVPLLAFAGLCVGLVAALLRRNTGGILAPIAAHLTWSCGMLFTLPTVLAVFA